MHFDTWIGFCLTWVLLDKSSCPVNKCKRTLCPERGLQYRSAADLSENASIKRLWKQICLKRWLKCHCFCEFVKACREASVMETSWNRQPYISTERTHSCWAHTHTCARTHTTMLFWTPGLFIKGHFTEMTGFDLDIYICFSFTYLLSKVLT